MKLIIETEDGITEPEVILRCESLSSPGVEYVLAVLRTIETNSEPHTAHTEMSPERSMPQGNFIKVFHDGRYSFIKLGDIIFTDTNERRTYIYTMEGCFESPLKLYELERILRGVFDRGFCRANKSMLCNIKRIKSIKNELERKLLLTMDNDMLVSVSRQYAPAVKKMMEELYA